MSHFQHAFIGILDKNKRQVLEGDVFFEEIEQDEGDCRLFSVVKWIPEWAMFTALSIGEYIEYQDNGVWVLKEDDAMRNTFILDEDEFKRLHYKGNIYDNPGLMEEVISIQSRLKRFLITQSPQ